jgi:hypothetical protein
MVPDNTHSDCETRLIFFLDVDISLIKRGARKMQYKREIWELENDNRRLFGSEEQARGEGKQRKFCDIIFIWWGEV